MVTDAGGSVGDGEGDGAGGVHGEGVSSGHPGRNVRGPDVAVVAWVL